MRLGEGHLEIKVVGLDLYLAKLFLLENADHYVLAVNVDSLSVFLSEALT